MNRDDYRKGKAVGFMIAAARSATPFATNFIWSQSELEEDKQELQQWAEIHGMELVIDERGTSMDFPKEEPTQPNLRVVN